MAKKAAKAHAPKKRVYRQRVLVLIRTDPSSSRTAKRIAEQLAALSQVTQVEILAERWQNMIVIEASQNPTIRQLIYDHLVEEPGIAEIQTFHLK